MRRVGLSVLLGLVVGCRPAGPAVRVEPARDSKPLIEQFTRAYFDTDGPTGDVVLLVDDPIEKVSGGAGGPVQPMASSPLRQALSVKIHWRVPEGTRAEVIAAANAVLDWYVYSDPDQPFGMAHYRGTGFVTIDPKGDKATVDIKAGELKLVKRAGVVIDPFGGFAVDGKFSAVRDKGASDGYLKDLKNLDSHS